MIKLRQDDVIKKASEVSNFCMELSKENRDRAHANNWMPYDDFTYAEALLCWKATGTGKDYFSTDDKFLLEFKQELQEKFGLEIVTRAEGNKRAASVKIVTGIPKVSDYMN